MFVDHLTTVWSDKDNISMSSIWSIFNDIIKVLFLGPITEPGVTCHLTFHESTGFTTRNTLKTI